MNKFLTITLVSNNKLAGSEKVISASKVITEEQLKEFYSNINEFFEESKVFTLATQEKAGYTLSELCDCASYAYEFEYTKEQLLKSIEVVDISDSEIETLKKFGVSDVYSDELLSDLELLFEI